MSYVSDSDRKSCDASDIVCRMSVILAGRVVILVILYVETFKTVVIVLISNIIMCLTSNRLIIFSIRVSYFMAKTITPYGHASTYQISLTYLERQKSYGLDKLR